MYLSHSKVLLTDITTALCLPAHSRAQLILNGRTKDGADVGKVCMAGFLLICESALVDSERASVYLPCSFN